MVRVVSRTNAWRLIMVTGLLWALAIMAALSTVPYFILRYLFLPQESFRVPIDFVSKNVTNPSATAVQEQLVALAELKEYEHMSKDNYRIDLELTLPRCEANRKHGPFTIKGALGSQGFTRNIHKLLNSRDSEARRAAQERDGVDIVERMAMLPYKSDTVETVARYAFMALYISDFRREESVIRVTLWHKALRPKAKRPHLLITLPKEVWVSDAYINFTVKVRGLKYYLKEYPVSSFLVVSLFSYIAEICAFAVSVGFLYLKFTESQPEPEPETKPYVTAYTASADEHSAPRSNRLSIVQADGNRIVRDRLDGIGALGPSPVKRHWRHEPAKRGPVESESNGSSVLRSEPSSPSPNRTGAAKSDTIGDSKALRTTGSRPMSMPNRKVHLHIKEDSLPEDTVDATFLRNSMPASEERSDPNEAVESIVDTVHVNGDPLLDETREEAHSVASSDAGPNLADSSSSVNDSAAPIGPGQLEVYTSEGPDETTIAATLDYTVQSTQTALIDSEGDEAIDDVCSDNEAPRLYRKPSDSGSEGEIGLLTPRDP